MKLYREWLQFNYIKFEESTIGFIFKYRGVTFIIPYNYDDKQFLRILMPNIYSVCGDSTPVLKAINKINSEMKVIKATLNDDNTVWLSIEMFIDSNPNIDDFMERLFDILLEGRIRFSFMLNTSIEAMPLKLPHKI